MLDYIPHLENDKKVSEGITSSNTNSNSKIDISNIPVPLQTLISAQPSALVSNVSDALFTLSNVQLQPVANKPDTELFNDVMNHEVVSSVFNTLKNEVGELNNVISSVLYGSQVDGDTAQTYDSNMIKALLAMELNGEQVNYEAILNNTKIIKLLYEYSRYLNEYLENVMTVIASTRHYFKDEKVMLLDHKDAEILSFDSKQDLLEQGRCINYVSSNGVICNLFKSCYNLVISIDDLSSIETNNENQEKAYLSAKEKLINKLNVKIRELFAAIEYCKQQFNSFSDIFYERNELIKSFCDNINNKTT
jgi:hypothetical protein